MDPQRGQKHVMMGKVNAVKSIIWGGLCWCRLDTMPSTLENWKTFSSLNPANSSDEMVTPRETHDRSRKSETLR